MTASRSLGVVWLLAAGFAGCSGERGPVEEGSFRNGVGIPHESVTARAFVEHLRQRFRWSGGVRELGAPLHRSSLARSPEPVSVLGAGVVQRFEPAAGGRMRAVVREGARRGVAKPARVELPVRASDMVRVEDETSGMAIAFALEGARGAEVAFADGIAWYEAALSGGADVLHRVTAEGTEDYAVFDARPELEELRYLVDVSGVGGLRLTANVLEFLDGTGTPRLRVTAPRAVDAPGMSHPIRVDVDGCAYDTDPRGPWGRPVVPPGAAHCTVRMIWEGTGYPLMVDPAWMATGKMITERTGHTATVLSDGTVLVAGGDSPSPSPSSWFPPSTAERYALSSGTWSTAGTMTSRRSGHTANLLTSGEVLVVGGSYHSPVLPVFLTQSTAELYNLAGGQIWVAMPAMHEARTEHAAAALPDGRLLVTGGGYAENIVPVGPVILSSAELYDHQNKQWSLTQDMASARSGHTASVVDGKVLVVGGFDEKGIIQASAELFDPAPQPLINQWSSAGSLTTARVWHTASVLPDGRVFIVGGVDINMVPLASTEVYDPSKPAKHEWSNTKDMATRRYGHAASVLNNGNILVVGGVDETGAAQSSAEVYDVDAGTWLVASDMAMARVGHTASTLDGGGVLVAGGIDPETGAEFYAPLGIGTSCKAPADCASGFCFDGVCCTTACGPCHACSLAAGAQSNGICTTLTGSKCDDGNACTQLDVCQAGVCMGTNPIACPTPDPCHEPGTCAPATGRCSTPAKPDGSSCPGGSCKGGICSGSVTSNDFYKCAASPAVARRPFPGATLIAAFLLFGARRLRRMPRGPRTVSRVRDGRLRWL